MVWTCLTCTFDNENQGLACVMCQTERISTSSTTAPAAMNKRNNDDDDNSSVIAISPHPALVPPKKQRFITQYTTQWEKTSETPSGWAQTNDPIASQCATQCATQYVTQCSTGCANHSVELEDDETGLALCLVSPNTDKQEMEDQETAPFLGGKFYGLPGQASFGQIQIYEAFTSSLKKISPTPSDRVQVYLNKMIKAAIVFDHDIVPILMALCPVPSYRGGFDASCGGSCNADKNPDDNATMHAIRAFFEYLKFPKVLLDLDAKIPGILLNCRDKCPLVQGKTQHCPRLTGEESAQLKAIFRLLLQTCRSLKKKCIVVNAGGSKMRGIFNDIVPSDDVLKLDSVHFSMYNYHNHKCYSNASDQKFVLSSIISGMDDQLKTFLVDIRPLNLPSLIDHMSHCRMITSIVPASGVGRFVQDGPAIYVSKRIYKQFTHEECSRGGKNSITKRKLDMKKYIADCSAGGKKGITKRKLDMKKFIADSSAGGITGGKNKSDNLQAILKVRSGVERYCAYCGTPRFFSEIRIAGVCMNGDCPSRNLNYKQHKKWRKTKPSEKEMKHFILAQSKQCINASIVNR
eukprot:g266.t1 g266   contig1:654752-656571(+)